METPAVYTPDARTKEEQIARLTELAGCVEAGILIRIAQAVLRARSLHPPRDYVYAMGAAKSEALEWEAQAMRVLQDNGGLDPVRLAKADKESLDVIATQFRLLARDFDYETAEDRSGRLHPERTVPLPLLEDRWKERLCSRAEIKADAITALSTHEKSQAAPATTLTPVIDTSKAIVGHIESGYASHALDAAAQGFPTRTCHVCGKGDYTPDGSPRYVWWLPENLCSACADKL